jgi:hypothetical protein
MGAAMTRPDAIPTNPIRAIASDLPTNREQSLKKGQVLGFRTVSIHDVAKSFTREYSIIRRFHGILVARSFLP